MLRGKGQSGSTGAPFAGWAHTAVPVAVASGVAVMENRPSNIMAVATVNISFQEDLLQQIDKFARIEARSRSELIREAARMYIARQQKWECLMAYGKDISSKYNITEDDINNEIKLYRQEKRQMDKTQIDFYMDLISDVAIKVIPKEKLENVCRDIDDDKYIENALASDAHYIISGDVDLLVLNEYKNIKIVTAKEYLDIVNT
jgi:putative PIN family toxin of toxin-antitoxin system